VGGWVELRKKLRPKNSPAACQDQAKIALTHLLKRRATALSGTIKRENNVNNGRIGGIQHYCIDKTKKNQ
jgi:hypothetical protein